MPSPLVRTAVALLIAVVLLGCGNPPLDLDVPARPSGAHLLDEVGVLSPAIEERLRELSEASGYDVVGLAFEDDEATRGQADRGGRRLLEAWDADIVLVVVAEPGDLTSDAADRSRYFGVYATDRFTVTRALRERILYERVQVPAGDNDWETAFAAAIDELEQELVDAPEG